MKRFEIFSHPVLGFEVIKSGFSWPGFFFTWIWLLICRMWGHAIAVAAIYVVATPLVAALFAVAIGFTMDDSMPEAEVDATLEGLFGMAWWVGSVVVNVVVGIKGNGWRQKHLVRTRAFRHLKTVQARSSEAALLEVPQEETSAAQAAPQC